MKSKTLTHIAAAMALALSLGATACSGGNAGNTAKESYVRNIKDSISSIKTEIDSCERAIDKLRESQDVWLRDFVTIDNPREAAPFMIFNSFKNKYPSTDTGLIARLAENGQFELIATLKGGRFNQIAVTGDLETVTSDIVPADQALNYYADGLNTVLFCGIKADSIGHLIADNDLNNVTVTFMNNKPVRAIKLPLDNRKMIMASYELYAAQKDIASMERRLPMLHRKIDLLRSHLDKTEQSDSTSSK